MNDVPQVPLGELNHVRTQLIEVEHVLRMQLGKVQRMRAAVDNWYWSATPYTGPMADNPPIIPERLALSPFPTLPEPEPPAG